MSQRRHAPPARLTHVGTRVRVRAAAIRRRWRPKRQPAAHSERWFPCAGMPPASLSNRARCSRFHVMNVVLRLVKSFCGQPEPWSGYDGPGPAFPTQPARPATAPCTPGVAVCLHPRASPAIGARLPLVRSRRTTALRMVAHECAHSPRALRRCVPVPTPRIPLRRSRATRTVRSTARCTRSTACKSYPCPTTNCGPVQRRFRYRVDRARPRTAALAGAGGGESVPPVETAPGRPSSGPGRPRPGHGDLHSYGARGARRPARGGDTPQEVNEPDGAGHRLLSGRSQPRPPP